MLHRYLIFFRIRVIVFFTHPFVPNAVRLMEQKKSPHLNPLPKGDEIRLPLPIGVMAFS
jgi:hypothetical protein